MFSRQGPIQNFFQGGNTTFRPFLSVVFSTDLILTNLSNKHDPREVREHTTPEIFWKFAYCNGHFGAFWTIFKESLSYFWPLTLSVSPTMMHLVRIVLTMRAQGDYGILLRRGSNLWKILFIQNIVENGWRGDAYAAYSTSPPGSAPDCIITKDILKF